MKTAKRVLAVLVAVVMVIGTCAVMASAGTYQAQINNGASKITLQADTKETLTVNNGTVEIDLNGYTLEGEDGKAAIVVNGGNVTVTNGQVQAFFGKMSTEQMLETVSDHCPAAIVVKGGSLTTDGVRLVGGMIRVPTTPIDNPTLVAAGSGIMSYNGAPVTLKRTSIIGDYGVNNKVRSSTVGGLVTVEDAIIIAYNTAIKGEYTVAEGSEEINAADRIAGAFKNGLDEFKQELAENLLNERTLIVTKTADQLAEDLGVDLPLITITEGIDEAEIEANVLDYTWKKGNGRVATDCSYKLVPEALILSDGTTVVLGEDPIEAEYVDLDAQLRYRVEFLLGYESKPYIDKLFTEGLDNPLDGALGWAAEELNGYYTTYTGRNNNGYVDTYGELIDTLAELMTTVDELGNKSVGEIMGLTPEQVAALTGDEANEANQALRLRAEYNDLRRALYRLAGKTAWAAKPASAGYEFTQNTYEAIFGADAGAMPEFVGTLDRVQKLKDTLEQKLGPTLFKNTAAYGDVAVWAVETAYPELLTILDEIIERLGDLDALLQQDFYAQMISFAGMEDEVALLGEGIENAQYIKTKLNQVLGMDDVAYSIQYVQDNSDKVKDLVNDAVDMIENWRDYVDLDALFVEDATFAKTYATVGSIQIEELSAPNNLHLTVVGSGKISYTVMGNAAKDTTKSDQTVAFRDTFKLEAKPDEGNEFLFWANKEGAAYRILSTEETFEWNTNIDRDIEAVYNSIDTPVAYFTNPTGDICGFADVDVINMTATLNDEISRPYVAGYGFDGWPGESDGVIDLTAMDNTAYAVGDSAFAKLNAYYGEEGAILRCNPECESFIIVTKYSKNGGYTVTFIDNGQTIVEEGNYSDIATRTSTYGNAYWVLTDDTSKIVCVNKTYPYQIIDNASFTAVEGECPEDFVFHTTVKVENGAAVFYVERSTKKAIKSTGLVYSVTGVTEPTIEAGCPKVSAKFTDKTGLFAPSVNLNWLGNRTFYGRPYVEFTDGTIEYGAVEQYN